MWSFIIGLGVVLLYNAWSHWKRHDNAQTTIIGLAVSTGVYCVVAGLVGALK